MSSKNTVDVGLAPAGPPKDIHGWLELLRTRVADLDARTDVDGVVWGVSDTAERIIGERQGMAEELWGVYEQLGIVFDVTRKLPAVQTESEVVELFVESLRRSFERRAVVAVRPGRNGEWVAKGSPLEITGGIDSLVQRARDTATVVVEKLPADSAAERVAEVMVGPVFAGDGFVCAIILTRGEGVPEFQASDMNLLVSLTTFCGDLIRNHRLVRELREMSFTMVRSLVNAVDQKDQYTSGHSMRVGYYATLLGRRLGMAGEDLRMLQWSALLHDVGKIGIRDEVLKKTGKLTEAEYAHIQEHPTRSHRVVREVPQLAGALAGVLHHHERYNGTGYPNGLMGKEIPLQARIIQIADVFDALTSDRSYRSAYDWPKALAILEAEAGETVDPDLQKVFAKLLRDILDDDPQAWDALVQRADQFTQFTGDETDNGER